MLHFNTKFILALGISSDLSNDDISTAMCWTTTSIVTMNFCQPCDRIMQELKLLYI